MNSYKSYVNPVIMGFLCGVALLSFSSNAVADDPCGNAQWCGRQGSILSHEYVVPQCVTGPNLDLLVDCGVTEFFITLLPPTMSWNIDPPFVNHSYERINVTLFTGSTPPGDYTFYIVMDPLNFPGWPNLKTLRILPASPYQNPLSAGPASESPGSVECGDPIDLGSGNLYETVVDFSTAGQNQLTFARHYNSLPVPNTLATTLGRKWRSNYDRYIRVLSSSSVVLQRETGKSISLHLVGGIWKSDNGDTDYLLTNVTTVWTLTTPDDTVETYITAPGGAARLSTITKRNGYTQTLEYDSSNRLTRVVDSYNRELLLAYSSSHGLLERITTPDGLVLTYGYDRGHLSPHVLALDRLTSVTFSTNPPTAQTYLYEAYYPNDPAEFTYFLSGVLDESGQLIQDWSYHLDERAYWNSLSTDTERLYIAYSDTNATRFVYEPLGLFNIYHFSTSLGVPKVDRIERTVQGTDGWTQNPQIIATRTFEYDANGYLASSTDWNGNRTTQVNDNRGQPTSITEGAATQQARTVNVVYHPQFHLPVQIIEPSRSIDFEYDTRGNLLTRSERDTATQTVPYPTSGQQRVWTYTYDELGNVLTADGPRTDVSDLTVYAYDNKGNLSSVTDALGHQKFITSYNLRGLPLSIVDMNGVVTDLTYDVKGRLKTHIVHASDGDAVTIFEYNAMGLLTAISLPNNTVMNYEYNNAHRLVAVSNQLGERIEYELNKASNVTKQTIKASNGNIANVQSQVFNWIGQLIRSVGANSQKVINYGYDSNENLISISNASNHTYTRAFDSLNRLITLTDPFQHSTHYSYDVDSNLTSIRDARSIETTYVYDGFGQVIQETSPDRGTTVLYRDVAGNVTQRIDGRGVVAHYTYDALDRVLSETFPASSSENRRFTYDNAEAGQYGIGRLFQLSDDSGNTTFVYDARGNIVENTRVIGGTTYITKYAYDVADQLVRITYPSGRIVHYSRDPLGRVNAISTQSSLKSGLVNIATAITYNPFGDVKGWSYGNGLTAQLNYDQDYQLRDIIVRDGTTDLHNLNLNYDLNGDIKSITDRLSLARNQSFEYDKLGRLIQASSGSNGNGIYGVEFYGYDVVGNRTTKTRINNAEEYTYADSNNHLLAISKNGQVNRQFSYDAVGDIIQDTQLMEVLDLSYNNAGRYQRLSTSTGINRFYTYNALGERVIKSSQPRVLKPSSSLKVPTRTKPPVATRGVTHYHYDLNKMLIAESNNAGGMEHEYIYLPGNDGWITTVALPLAQLNNVSGGSKTNELLFVLNSHLRTPAKLTDTRKQIVWDRTQTPFGETATLAGTKESNLRMPGQYHDTESNYHYNMFREYDAQTGRYIQSDPIGLRGGMNVYGYANNSPILELDPLGLESGPYNVYRYTLPGETFYRYESGYPQYSKVGPQGQLAPNTYATPESQLYSSRDAVKRYNLPQSNLERGVRYCITPPAGTRVIGPNQVANGLGSEVNFPKGAPKGSVTKPPVITPGGGGGPIPLMGPWNPKTRPLPIKFDSIF